MQAGLTSLLDNSHLTLELGCDPASSQAHLEETDSRPAGGRVQALSLATAGDQWASVLGLLHSPQCWLPSRMLGRTTGPTWVLFTVLCPALGTGGHCHSNCCILWTGFTLVPLSSLSWEALCFCLSPGPLGSLLAQGPGLGCGSLSEVQKILSFFH